ncbi:hypothetical protein Gpo141_00014609, partial [Globisporangium polare]
MLSALWRSLAISSSSEQESSSQASASQSPPPMTEPNEEALAPRAPQLDADLKCDVQRSAATQVFGHASEGSVGAGDNPPAEITAPSPPPPSTAAAKRKVWYCVACDEEFATDAKAHMSTHVACVAPNCSFSASQETVQAHVVAKHSGKTKKSADTSASPSTSRVTGKPAATTAEPWQRDCVLPPAGQSTVPPDTYTCKICSVPGHWIYSCKQFIKSGDMVKQPVASLKHEQAPSLNEPKQIALSKTKVKHETWRCETCEKSFPNDSQLKSHFGDHVA